MRLRSAALSFALAALLPAASRESITFILGRDKDDSNPLYRLAETCFRETPAERTDHVVTGLGSLQEVRDYLEQHAPRNGAPWGLVNFVAHGSAAGQLDVPLAPRGPKTTRASLSEALDADGFKPLPDTLLDDHSEIRIHGCSVGKDARFLRLISLAFGGADPQRPLVRASKWFTCFQSEGPHSVRYLCKEWNLTVGAGEALSAKALSTRFRASHADLPQDLEEALERRAPRFPGDTFSYEAPARFCWSVLYPGSQRVPILPSTVKERAWLLSQDALRSRLYTLGLAFDQLHWEVQRTRLPLDGADCPALTAIGQGRTIHVLRALASDVSSPPPTWEDTRYYAAAR